jgi:LysM repeat protein
VGSLALVVGLVVGLLAGRPGVGASRPAAARVYVVRPGDTLWGIAAGLVGRAGDPRPVVDRLARLNRVQGGVIRPGQELRLAP